MLPIVPYRFHYSLHGVVSFWLGPFRVLSERVLFMALSDRVIFRVLSSRVPFRVLLRILADSVLFRVLSPRFLVCRVPSVASTTLGVLQWFSVFNISIATDVLILSLENLMQLREVWAIFWKQEKGFILDFWLGSEYTYAVSFIFRSIHPELFRKIAFLKGFSRFLETFPWRRTSQRSYMPKTRLLHGCYPVKQLFWCFLNSCIKDYKEFFNTLVPLHSNYTLPQHKKERKGNQKVIR